MYGHMTQWHQSGIVNKAEILLSHKKNITQPSKKWNNAICSNMNGPRDYHTKWSKSDREREISFDITYMWNWGFPSGSAGRESTCNARDTKDTFLIPELGRSPGGGYGNPLQYSYLENPMDWRAWQAIQSKGSQGVGRDWVTNTHTHTHTHTHIIYIYT